MLQKFLKEVVSMVVGNSAKDIVDLINSKKHVNEFIISKKMDLTINQTRNILYKLADYGLVSSIRKKDKKKGWYTYFWKIEVLKALEFLENFLNKRIGQLEFQMKSREAKTFYICERCKIEFSEENALLNEFTCNECGNVFAVRDNSSVLKEFKKNLDRMKKEKALLDAEIEKEKEKISKQRMIELKKEAREAAKKKAAKKKKKKVVKKTKKKVAKKVKKVSKKKIVKKKKAAKKKKKKVVKKTKKKVAKKVKKVSKKVKKAKKR